MLIFEMRLHVGSKLNTYQDPGLFGVEFFYLHGIISQTMTIEAVVGFETIV